jgi:antitoxin VapB
MADTAKLFITGRSQAVRLPKEYRFEGEEVFIRRDPVTGDVILSSRPASWKEFFELCDRSNIPADFLSETERSQGNLRPDPFDWYDE